MSITAGCSVVDVEMAFLIGVIGGIVYYSASQVQLTTLTVNNSKHFNNKFYFIFLWISLSSFSDNTEREKNAMMFLMGCVLGPL